KLTDAQGRFFYQLQDFRDSEQNTYSFTYDAAGRFSRITEPGGRFLELTYRQIAGQAVIGKVETADLRSVTYGYTAFNDGVRSWVALTSAIYGDGTQAAYGYTQASPGVQPLLKHAVDPRYPGPAVNMKYLYAASPLGFVQSELNGATAETMVTLQVSGSDYTLAYANGSNRLFNM